jgi:hypothetical protein
MKHGKPTNEHSERRLDKASKHVTTLWFPVNPETLASIRRHFAKGTFNSDPERLFDMLKTDFALFTFLVKELVPVATEQKMSNEIINNPMELLRWAGSERIKAILSDDNLIPSNHLFQNLEPFQAERLRETAIIASTAEVLSEKHNLDPETGFCRGVIREIGLNLIAWNYPTLYARVLKNLTPSKSLDEELTTELGFSPSLLAMRVLRPRSGDISSDMDTMKQTWATYDRLCEVGEALARAENPATYPSAENDWKLASDYLEKTVGSQAIDLIKNRAIEHSREYERTLANSFQSLAEFSPERKVKHFKKQENARNNRYLSQCPPEIQAALRNMYAEINGENSPRAALEMLFQSIIPQAGFTGGCVFVVDPSSFALTPRTKFGKIRLRAIEQVALRHSLQNEGEEDRLGVLMTKPSVESDSAATALSCAHPVIERHEELEDNSFTGMYGSLGDSRKIGVLYLEAPAGATIDQDTRSVGTFKAVRQALSDALRLD